MEAAETIEAVFDMFSRIKHFRRIGTRYDRLSHAPSPLRLLLAESGGSEDYSCRFACRLEADIGEPFSRAVDMAVYGYRP